MGTVAEGFHLKSQKTGILLLLGHKRFLDASVVEYWSASANAALHYSPFRLIHFAKHGYMENQNLYGNFWSHLSRMSKGWAFTIGRSDASES